MIAAGCSVLRLENIRKTFPGVVALDNVSLEVHKGEILGLVGENGAGKSTLMKILSGAYTRDSGEIVLEGERVEIDSPITGRNLGISIIYQELSLIRQLSVTENLFLGNLKHKKNGVVDWKAMRKEAISALREMGLGFSVDLLIRDLNIAQCQMVEICRATIINKAKVLIMDEPTSSLIDREIEHMFTQMIRLKAQGISIIYVTHRLDELFRITDSISVLKDGRNNGSFITMNTDKLEIVHSMVGREIGEFYPPNDSVRGKSVLEVHNLSQGKVVKNVSFTAYAGEILGFAGLIGSGRSETMMSIFGAMNDVTGEVLFNGKPVHFKRPKDAIKAGIALAPEDRKVQGLVLNMSIAHNTTLANLGGVIGKMGWLSSKKELMVANDYIKQLNIRTPDSDKRVVELSGGNQQKVIVGKWLFTDAKVLIFDEPTKGIDVGTKAEIYRIMRRLANEGVAVIMISSDLPEVIGVSDRIIVMHEGEFKGEFSNQDVSEAIIMKTAIGGVAN